MKTTAVIGFCVLIAIGANTLYAQQRMSFQFEGHTIDAGERRSFALPVEAASGQRTEIPMTIVHGKDPGPVLGLIAGIHGYEYPPIVALQSLGNRIDASQLRGTIIIVHIANLPAFLGRSVYYNPVDGKNLNRVFPGSREGTLSDVMAWTIANRIIARCELLVDIHAGDASEDLHPYTGYYEYGEQTRKAKQMAYALGFSWVILSENAPKPGVPTHYCSAEGISRGIPTVAIEYGKLGQVDRQQGEFINDRLINMMRTLKMVPGEPVVYSDPVEIRKRTSIVSEHTGIFVPGTSSGEIIRKGMVLGRITDYYGKLMHEVVSPVDGFVIYMLSTPPVNRGEVLFSLAVTD